MTESISANGVSASQLRLMGEDVLVRAMPAEEVRASGLWVPNQASVSFGRGSEFYGTIVAMGPGRLVERGPSADLVASFARKFVDNEITELSDVAGIRAQDAYKTTDRLYDGIVKFVNEHTKQVRVPLPWNVGDTVLCRQGFGPEIELREGRHHVIGRGNSDHGHGIIAAWDAAHVHCYHRTGDGAAECACGSRTDELETRLPSCSSCPPGERLAEAVVARKVYDFKPGPGPSEAERGIEEVARGFRIGEERPETIDG